MCQHAKFYGDRPNHAQIWRFFDFSKQQPSAILDLLWTFLDHPRRVFGGIYHCTKFRWNRCSSFHNLQVLVFNDAYTHAIKQSFLGIIPLNGEQPYRDLQRPPACVETRHTTYIDRSTCFCAVQRFIQPPKSCALQWARHFTKSVPCCGNIPSNTQFPGFTRLRIPNGISIVSAVLHLARYLVQATLQQAAPSPVKISHGDLDRI